MSEVTLHGCRLELLQPRLCRELIDWARGAGEGRVPEGAGEAVWLLAHCDDGVVWGHRRTPGRAWARSTGAFDPPVSPRLDPATLQELRLFGPTEELLVWRNGAGAFAGRRLADDATWAGDAWCEPMKDQRVILGNLCVSTGEGFTHVASSGGSRQAVPVECNEADFTGDWWPLRLGMRHYFERSPATGAVRVAATRLVDVRKETRP